MCQWDILEHLRRTPRRWLTSKEIADEMGVTKNVTDVNLNRMRTKNLVRFKLVRKNIGGGERRIYAYAAKVR